ncbi:hypothetical protein [Roseinatronobacter monicus]|uniref:Uncharacterized protein n=1 Tax=Roseinatronobacter monicus TaxID=393481 RepID=A0A543K527_9RHOB|nr:hypothetical protein [Roseinatronobacter monicus]TQM90179.1 hypothetical protein BD293_4105 [Roseinatronobacter monicus]
MSDDNNQGSPDDSKKGMDISKLAEQLQLPSGRALGDLTKQLNDQFRSIEALRAPSLPTALRTPPRNPTFDTNDHLERIEQRFDKMLDVAANGAQIATELQAHAADFLKKFEKAASDNDRSAERAIRLGGYAVLIALVAPIFQIVYTEVWRVPKETASIEAVILDMQVEIASLRQTQIEAADRIADALERSDQQLIDVLRDVANSLAVHPPNFEIDPDPAE